MRENPTTEDLRDPATLTADFTPRLHADVAMVEVGDEMVLYDQSNGHLHQVDAIGSLVCRLLDGTAPVATIADDLAEAFDEPRDAVERDVLATVRQLGDAGVLDGVAGQHIEDVGDEDAHC